MAPPEGLVLQGIFIDEPRRQALVTSPSHPDGVWLKLGSAFEGWTIRRIEPDRIALGSGTKEIAFTLYVDNAGQ
jgi:hypothetical protein